MDNPRSKRLFPSDNQYFEFTEWVQEMQVPRGSGNWRGIEGKWILSDTHGNPVYKSTKELFNHWLKNKTKH
jgi:hypothetical protein